MPLFEVERDGKRFEVDAPDLQTAASAIGGAKNYSWGDVPGAAAGNFMKNAGEVGSSLLEAASQPIETAKNIGKLGVGMVQEMIPGQQEYETSHADPFYKQVFEDYGGVENIKRTIAEKPVQALLDASVVGAGIPGRAGRVARLGNPIQAAGKGVTTVAKRAVTPFPARPGAADAATALRAEGVPLTAGQATGSKGLKYAESELGGGTTGNLLDAQSEAFTQAASRRIGLNSPHLDGDTMEQAYRAIGGEIGAIAGRNTLQADNRLMRDAYNAAGEYNRQVPPTMRVPAVAETLAEIQSMRGALPGDRYQVLRSRLGKEARDASGDPQLQRALYGLQHSLDDAMERSVPAADRGALQNARRQYRNYLVLERAMATGGAETAAGLLTPAKLEQALSQIVGKRGYLHGRHDFGPLAKAGKVAMSKMPESGTSSRNWARAVPAAGGAILGGATGGVMEGMAGAALGMAAPAAAGRAMMSRPVQAYLGNQVMPAGQTAVGRAAGRTALPAAAGVSRVEALKQAEAVLSPKVLDHVKRSENTRGPLSRWLKARNSGQGVDEATQQLAEAIATEVQQPELAGRIVEELSAVRPPQ